MAPGRWMVGAEIDRVFRTVIQQMSLYINETEEQVRNTNCELYASRSNDMGIIDTSIDVDQHSPYDMDVVNCWVAGWDRVRERASFLNEPCHDEPSTNSIGVAVPQLVSLRPTEQTGDDIPPS